MFLRKTQVSNTGRGVQIVFIWSTWHEKPSKYVLHLCNLLDQNVLSYCSSPVFILCFITLENESLIMYFVFTLFYYKDFGKQSADAENREQLNLLSLERIWKQRRHQKMHWTKSPKSVSIPYTKRLDIMQNSQTFLCSMKGIIYFAVW